MHPIDEGVGGWPSSSETSQGINCREVLMFAARLNLCLDVTDNDDEWSTPAACHVMALIVTVQVWLSKV